MIGRAIFIAKKIILGTIRELPSLIKLPFSSFITFPFKIHGRMV